MLIDLIVGARPNFVKVAPLIRELGAHSAEGGKMRYRLVHTGQHYDSRMSGDFFDQLDIPEPDINLQVGSGTQAQQTAAIMVRYEGLLLEKSSDLCVVVGDVNSTMACAITAKKLGIRVAHIEAGIRSGDITMPEEVNRIVTDSITDLFFTTTENSTKYLKRSGISEDKIYFVGNTMIDTLLFQLDNLIEPDFVAENNLSVGKFLVTTLHRPANVDETVGFMRLVQMIAKCARSYPIVFPVHPRTRRAIQQVGELPSNIIFVEPQPYLQFVWLIKNSMAVITDSGGITEETTVLGIPCITLRDNTERPETIEIGTNVLAGANPTSLKEIMAPLFDDSWKKGSIPPKWDGKTAKRIVSTLNDLFG
ncbi:UDP-N-acetylglucosamine 2-epimerase (non-hydrolyzing) [Rhodobacteraceae bacterium R_SAG10]|nr:UDP-N-acetylglucosamine 2-epimerase (non-hydrolyzing) [Rhodobacteraceae bacterium R_SAG10]